MRLGVASKPRQILFLTAPDLAAPDFNRRTFSEWPRPRQQRRRAIIPSRVFPFFDPPEVSVILSLVSRRKKYAYKLHFALSNYRRMHDIKADGRLEASDLTCSQGRQEDAI